MVTTRAGNQARETRKSLLDKLYQEMIAFDDIDSYLSQAAMDKLTFQEKAWLIRTQVFVYNPSTCLSGEGTQEDEDQV